MSAGRFAPTPSAELHLGNLRTALVAWLFARSTGSPFILRIEDLDPATRRPGVAASQIGALTLLGIDWDGPVIFQSAHPEGVTAAVDRLVGAGLTYPCFCTRREIQDAAQAPHGGLPEGAYPGTCRDLSAAEQAARAATGRPAALRLRSGHEVVTVADRRRGEVTATVDDLVLRRNDGVPAYNLAVVVDDAAAGVEEVVRGDDLLLSTPRQVHLARLLGLPVPSYAHVPLVVNGEGRRLAKRDGAVTLDDRLALGESPGDVVRMLAASLGLLRSDVGPDLDADLDPVTPSDLLERFDPDTLPTEPWIFPG